MAVLDGVEIYVFLVAAVIVGIYAAVAYLMKKKITGQVAFAIGTALLAAFGIEVLIYNGTGMTTPPLDMFYPLLQYGLIAFSGALIAFATGRTVRANKWFSLAAAVLIFVLGALMYFAELLDGNTMWWLPHMGAWFAGVAALVAIVIASPMVESFGVVASGSAEKCGPDDEKYIWLSRALVLIIEAICVLAFFAIQIASPTGTDMLSINHTRDGNSIVNIVWLIASAIVLIAVSTYLELTPDDKEQLRDAAKNPRKAAARFASRAAGKDGDFETLSHMGRRRRHARADPLYAEYYP
jgi:hypothetical protein